jgi:hypothetical protein
VTPAEVRLRAVIHQQMAALEKALKGQGAGEWESVIITYHPDDEEAYIVTLTQDATVQHTHDLLGRLRDKGEA